MKYQAWELKNRGNQLREYTSTSTWKRKEACRGIYLKPYWSGSKKQNLTEYTSTIGKGNLNGLGLKKAESNGIYLNYGLNLKSRIYWNIPSTTVWSKKQNLLEYTSNIGMGESKGNPIPSPAIQ